MDFTLFEVEELFKDHNLLELELFRGKLYKLLSSQVQ